MNTRLSKGIVYIFIANTITLVANIISNFVLPKKLSIDSYASIKTFQLYMTYIGIFHFGYADGIYLNYGGGFIDSVDRKILNESIGTARAFQIMVMIGMMLVSAVLRQPILFCFSLAIFPVNITSCYRMLFQAVGEFAVYRRVINYTAILMLTTNLLLAIMIKTDEWLFYLFGYILVYIFIMVTLEVRFSRNNNTKIKIYFKYDLMKKNIKTGFFLMCGNFASFFLSTIDRWFVKVIMSNSAFAQYSFAVSLENMLNLAITPIAIPLYNFFCTNTDKKTVRTIHQVVCVFSSIIIAPAFLAKLAIECILPRYEASIIVVFLLFGGQAFQFVVKAVYVNLYKAEKLQKKYMIGLCSIIFIGIALNAILYSLLKTKESFAIATLICSVLWLLVVSEDLKQIEASHWDLVYMFVVVVVFLFFGINCSALQGLLLYIIVVCTLNHIFMYDAVNFIRNNILREFKCYFNNTENY